MNKSLLDTDILSECFRARNPIVVQQAVAYQAAMGQLTISAVTVMEVVTGLQQMQRTEALRRFLENLKSIEVLAFDQACAEIAGRIQGELLRIGQTIGNADCMIAATALRYNLTLVTGNAKHYQRIVALRYPLQLDNWR